MKAILIADSGSSKCEWCIAYNGKELRFFTIGISPYFLTPEEINTLLHKEVMPVTEGFEIGSIFFYGTGLGNDQNIQIIRKVLEVEFANAQIHCETDLLGAARATCINERGVTCIIGTGCNSCFYDGNEIVKNQPSLGYVLGDEGSGAYLGRLVLRHYLYGTLEPELMQSFDHAFNLSLQDILNKVYKEQRPNQFLSSFTMFLTNNRGHQQIEEIIEAGLNDFFTHHILQYPESLTYPVHFVGSVSNGFSDVIQLLCSRYAIETGMFLKEPMDGLVKYHT